MNIEVALRLLVTLARLLDISPEVLAAMYQDETGNQEYFDKLVQIVSKTPTGLSA